MVCYAFPPPPLSLSLSRDATVMVCLLDMGMSSSLFLLTFVSRIPNTKNPIEWNWYQLWSSRLSAKIAFNTNQPEPILPLTIPISLHLTHTFLMQTFEHKRTWSTAYTRSVCFNINVFWKIVHFLENTFWKTISFFGVW